MSRGSRQMMRRNAKAAFTKFKKENPQYKAMSFSAFNKLRKEGYIASKPKAAEEPVMDIALDDILADDIEETEEDGSEVTE